MTVKEYDAMQAAKGTPKVWAVRYAITCPGMVHTTLFATEQEAREFAGQHSRVVSVGWEWDIWNWTAKHAAKN